MNLDHIPGWMTDLPSPQPTRNTLEACKNRETCGEHWILWPLQHFRGLPTYACCGPATAQPLCFLWLGKCCPMVGRDTSPACGKSTSETLHLRFIDVQSSASGDGMLCQWKEPISSIHMQFSLWFYQSSRCWSGTQQIQHRPGACRWALGPKLQNSPRRAFLCWQCCSWVNSEALSFFKGSFPSSITAPPKRAWNESPSNWGPPFCGVGTGDHIRVAVAL